MSSEQAAEAPGVADALQVVPETPSVSPTREVAGSSASRAPETQTPVSAVRAGVADSPSIVAVTPQVAVSPSLCDVSPSVQAAYDLAETQKNQERQAQDSPGASPASAGSGSVEEAPVPGMVPVVIEPMQSEEAVSTPGHSRSNSHSGTPAQTPGQTPGRTPGQTLGLTPARQSGRSQRSGSPRDVHGVAEASPLEESPCAQEMMDDVRMMSPAANSNRMMGTPMVGPVSMDQTPARGVATPASLATIMTPARSAAHRGHAQGGPPPGLNMQAPTDAPIAPAVPAVSPAHIDILEELQNTWRHPDAAISAVQDEERTWDRICCQMCCVFPAVFFLAPFMLMYQMFCLPLYLWACCCMVGNNLEDEVQENGQRRRLSTHSPGFMQRPRDGAEPALPAKLRGVFYLRPSPFDHALVCLERAEWDAERSTLKMPWHLPRARVFKQSFWGATSLATYRIFRTGSEYQFSALDPEAAARCEGVVRTKVCGVKMPQFISSATMVDVSTGKDGSLWMVRRTFLGYRCTPHWAERVVDAQGVETPYQEHVRNEVEAKRCFFV